MKKIIMYSMALSAISACLFYFIFGAKFIGTGIAFGFTLGAIELLFLSGAVKSAVSGVDTGKFILGYFVKAAFIRLPVLCGFFLLCVAVAKINPIGLILGLTIALTSSSIILVLLMKGILKTERI